MKTPSNLVCLIDMRMNQNSLKSNNVKKTDP